MKEEYCRNSIRIATAESTALSFSNHNNSVPVIKTIASQKKGIKELLVAIQFHLQHSALNTKRIWLLTEKAFHLIEQKRMKDVNKEELKIKIEKEGKNFNLYKFIIKYY